MSQKGGDFKSDHWSKVQRRLYLWFYICCSSDKCSFPQSCFDNVYAASNRVSVVSGFCFRARQMLHWLHYFFLLSLSALYFPVKCIKFNITHLPANGAQTRRFTDSLFYLTYCRGRLLLAFCEFWKAANKNEKITVYYFCGGNILSGAGNILWSAYTLN